MALDFIVTALPRSGTTWAANWLTTDKSICLHDATGRWLPNELDAVRSPLKHRGISCTGAWMWKDWVEKHPGNVLILERDPDEVNASLAQLGLPSVSDKQIDWFKSVKGVRIPYTEMFTDPEGVWQHLLPELPFDRERFDELVKMSIQPIESVMLPDAEYLKKAMKDLGDNLSRIL